MKAPMRKTVRYPDASPGDGQVQELRETREYLQAALERVDAVLGRTAVGGRRGAALPVIPGGRERGRGAAPGLGTQGAPRQAVGSLAELRAALGWSRALLAGVLNCSERALVNWEQGEPASAVYAARGRELQRLFEQLTSLMKPEEVGPWLNTEMEEFEGRRPTDLIRQGETGRVWESLYFLRSGQPD
jgi:transcriptional regulator with XRE-family HTH domain